MEMKQRTKLLTQGLELIKIGLVLLLVLDLLFNSLEHSDGSRVAVDATSGLDGSGDDLGGGDEIVGEAVVETALNLEEILSSVEKLDVSLGELFKGLLGVAGGVADEEGGGNASPGGEGGAGGDAESRGSETGLHGGGRRDSGDN